MKNRKLLGAFLIIALLTLTVGVSIAFFNYTRTGTENVLSVGRISFVTNQTNTITLQNIFPIDSGDVDTDTTNVGTFTVTISGDTDYSEGIEYLVSSVDSNLETTGGKKIPVSLDFTISNLGTSNDNYFTARESKNATIYKLLNEEIDGDKKILVGYIKPNTTLGTAEGVNGSISIKAYLDKDKIAISDTYDETESDNMGTTNDWVSGRTVLTTAEWNLLQANGMSFKVRIEANEGIWVEDTNALSKVRKSITEKINATTNACNPIWVDDNDTANDETDDITYFSGTNDCVNMNYVWYSGKLWRITAIYPDGSMKMVTQNNITSIAYNEAEQVDFYTDVNTTSYMYQWLNEDFYYTLYHASEFIDTTKQWNATIASSNIRPAETTMISANVGLLNSYEYYNAYRKVSTSTNYLHIGFTWRLLNPYSASELNYVFYSNGVLSHDDPKIGRGVRPSIYLKSGLEFTGSGTIGNPYKIVGDKDIGKTNDLINTRLSGEYVKLKSGNNEQLFRIIGIEDNKTKIIALDYAADKAEKKISTKNNDILWGSGTTTSEGTWYTYLNNTYLQNLNSVYGEIFDSGTYYLGQVLYNYKLSICANVTSENTKECTKTSQAGAFNIGLPRYGEMFATQQSGGFSNSISMWLINGRAGSTGQVNEVTSSCDNQSNGASGTRCARPTVHLKSTVKIISGSGTESDPYVVGL